MIRHHKSSWTIITNVNPYSLPVLLSINHHHQPWSPTMSIIPKHDLRLLSLLSGIGHQIMANTLVMKPVNHGHPMIPKHACHGRIIAITINWLLTSNDPSFNQQFWPVHHQLTIISSLLTASLVGYCEPFTVDKQIIISPATDHHSLTN